MKPALALKGSISPSDQRRPWRSLWRLWCLFALQAVFVFTCWVSDLPFWPFSCTAITGAGGAEAFGV